jgi:hypothetical protein
MKRLALCALLAACGGSSGSPAPSAPLAAAPTCSAVVARLMAAASDEMFEDVDEKVATRWRGRIESAMTVSCTDDRWPPALLACVDAADEDSAVDACNAHVDERVSAAMMARLQPLMSELTAELKAADEAEYGGYDEGDEGGDDEIAAAAPTAAVPDAKAIAALRAERSGATECDQLLASYADFLVCDKVPTQAKAASTEGVEAMRASWAVLRDPNLPADARRQVADSCAAGRDALRQSLQALGCEL